MSTAFAGTSLDFSRLTLIDCSLMIVQLLDPNGCTSQRPIERDKGTTESGIHLLIQTVEIGLAYGSVSRRDFRFD